jgi:hypothetical protein
MQPLMCVVREAKKRTKKAVGDDNGIGSTVVPGGKDQMLITLV